MQNKSIFSALVFSLLVVFSVQAQEFPGMDKSPMDAASFPSSYKESNKAIKIVYSRPQLNGRSLAKLAPNGKIWRTGANEAAELTLYTDMTLGGKDIKAGTYTFYVIPGEKEWTAIVSTDLNVWGSYFYNEANDVARLTVPAKMADESIEAFAMTFTEGDNGVDLHLGWDKVRVTVPFKKK